MYIYVYIYLKLHYIAIDIRSYLIFIQFAVRRPQHPSDRAKVAVSSSR